MSILYTLPSYVLLFLAAALAAGLACAGQIIVHRRFKPEDFVHHNEVAGFIIAVVGTLYAVLLGFVTVVVWQQYDNARVKAALEAASVGNAWHNAVGLPQPERSVIRHDMLEYVQGMLRDEWPAMHAGGYSSDGDRIIMHATTVVGQMVPADLAQANAQAATLHLLTDLHDSRQERYSSNESSISGFQWTVLFVGAIVVIGFCYLFGVERRPAHLIMTGAVAIMVASMFVLIFELEDPFRSDLGIPPTPWTALLAHMQDMDSQPGPMKM
jgi:hypothetical protein